MGIGLWLGCGIASFLLARIIPLGRRRAWLTELLAALVTALLCGVLATGLDFGGWNEIDWRAGVFAALGAVAAIGAVRAVRLRN